MSFLKAGNLLPWVVLPLLIAGCSGTSASVWETASVQALEALAPTEIGADREGRVWAWSGREVVMFDLSGQELWRHAVDPRAYGVDADGDWGVVFLRSDRRGLAARRPNGEELGFRLLDEANRVAWIDAGTIVVVPAFAAHLVQVWQLTDGLLLEELIEDSPVSSEPGVHLAHSYEVEPLPESGGWVLLDSYRGNLTRYHPSGRALARTAVADPGNDHIESWRRTMDADARATGDVQRPTIWRFHVALDEAGGAWVVEGCSEAEDEARLLHLDAEGREERHHVETTCCSRRFTVTNGSLLFHERAKEDSNGCVGTGSLP